MWNIMNRWNELYMCCIGGTHRGIIREIPLWDWNVVVGRFAGGPFFGFSFPQYSVEVGEVMVDVYSIAAPSTQRPAAELRTLS